MATYQFYLESCEVMDTRAFHEDTIVAGLGCIVNQKVHDKTIAAQIGDHNNGKFVFWQEGLGSLDKVEIGEDDQFVFVYQLYNNGQAGRPSVADVEAYIDRDLLGAANDLISMAQSAGDLNSVNAQLAQVDIDIKKLMDELNEEEKKEADEQGDRLGMPQPLIGPANKLAGLAHVQAPVPHDTGLIGRLAGRRVREPSPAVALRQQFEELKQQKVALVEQLRAIKAKAASFSVLMPGADWRPDGPFTTGDYSVQNYSRGKLISILGNLILAGCDGPLAFGFVAGNGAELEKRIPAVGPLRLAGEFKAKDLGWDSPCNPSGSHYVVNTVIQRQ